MSQVPAPEQSQTGQSGTAFVVEDDAMIASILHFVLEREGYGVRHAVDGRVALQMLGSIEVPEVVLLDVMLPYVDGFQLIAAIRAQAGWEAVPVLMLTSKGGERDIARALDAGADDYMVKPFQLDELRARLRRLLRSRK